MVISLTNSYHYLNKLFFLLFKDQVKLYFTGQTYVNNTLVHVSTIKILFLIS